MPIQQVAFEVPMEIAKGIAAGDLIQYGGIVRDAAGHIVKHLKPVQQVAEENAAGALAAAVAVVKANKKLAIGIGAAAALFTAGGVIVHKVMRSKEDAVQEHDSTSFNEALSEYCTAIQEGTMSKDAIDRLIQEIDCLAAEPDEEVTIRISKKQLHALSDMMYDYSVALSEANGFDAQNVERPSVKSAEAALAGFKGCLEIQKEIFEKAA